MNVTVEQVGAVQKKLSVVIPAERVDREIQKAYDDIQKHAVVKGFRKGKAPRSQIEKQYALVMQEEVIKKLFQTTYHDAIKEHDVAAVSWPTVDFGELAKGMDFTYTAVVEVFPDVRAVDYRGLEVQRERFVFDETQVDERLRKMQESMAELVPVDRKEVRGGDFVLMDFEGFIDGEPMENGSARDFSLEIGSNQLIPGFEEQLVGLTRGEEREISVTFPEDYHAAQLAGKGATFRVMVKEIKEKRLPELDDSFAAEFGEFETIEALRNAIAENIQQQAKERIESEFRDRLIEALIARNPIEVPSSMVERQLEQMLQSAKRRLAAQRMTLEMMGMTEDRYRSTFRHVAEAQVKGGLLLEAVARQENLVVTEEDLERKLVEVSGGDEETLRRIKEYHRQNEEARASLEAHLREEKAISFLAEHAIVTEISGDETGKERA